MNWWEASALGLLMFCYGWMYAKLGGARGARALLLNAERRFIEWANAWVHSQKK